MYKRQVLGCSALLDRFARYHFKRVSLGLYLLLQIPLVMCCGVLYLLKFPTFYSLPIALGLAFSVWGLYFLSLIHISGIPFNEFANSFQDSGVSMTMLDLFTGGALSNFSDVYKRQKKDIARIQTEMRARELSA